MPVTPHAAPPPRPVPRPVDPGQPFTWLARGWADLLRQPVPGLLHGLATAVFGALLVALAHDRFWLLAGAFSGFMLVACMPSAAAWNGSSPSAWPTRWRPGGHATGGWSCSACCWRWPAPAGC